MMSENKHSSSPWIFCGNHVDDSMGRTICKSVRSFQFLNPLDFHLMAAAPDLLKALDRMIETHGMHGPCSQHGCRDCRTAYDKAKAAIVKATGKDGA